MRALSIRQPYVEEILRGVKTIEYRSRSTRIIGQRFYIYASQKPADGQEKRFAKLGCEFEDLPSGVIVGSAVISHVTYNKRMGLYEWHLTGIKRLKRHRKPSGHPQPVWFTPF